MKASSESGLWATAISRTGAETVLIGIINSCMFDRLSSNAECGVETRLAASPSAVYVLGAKGDAASCVSTFISHWRRKAFVPASGKTGGHQGLDNFGEGEPVEAPLKRLRYRMSQHKKPAEASRKKHDFACQSGERSPGEMARGVFVNPCCRECSQRIGHQESAGGANDLRNSTRTGGIEYRQTGCTFDQVER